MKQKVYFLLFVIFFLAGCSGFQPGDIVIISKATIVNEINFSPYRQWYFENGGCTMKGTATVLEKGIYLPDIGTLYLVENDKCKGWIPGGKLQSP